MVCFLGDATYFGMSAASRTGYACFKRAAGEEQRLSLYAIANMQPRGIDISDTESGLFKRTAFQAQRFRAAPDCQAGGSGARR